jgi:hypothetical protein
MHIAKGPRPAVVGGKGVAGVKAGPWAEDLDVKRADARVKRCAIEREKKYEWKLSEGV